MQVKATTHLGVGLEFGRGRQVFAEGRTNGWGLGAQYSHLSHAIKFNSKCMPTVSLFVDFDDSSLSG